MLDAYARTTGSDFSKNRPGQRGYILYLADYLGLVAIVVISELNCV